MNFQIRYIPLALVLALSGCSKKSPEELVADAQQKIVLGQNAEGIIDLKNAIQAAPQNAQARYLLGKAYLSVGSAASAEKELLQAMKLGYEKNEIVPLLANAYNLQFKNDDIIQLVNETKGLDPSVQTSLLLYQALAYFNTEKPFKAKQAIVQANEISSDSIYSQLGNAYASFSDNQIDTSLQQTDQLLEQQPELAEAVLLKAQLATINKDYPLAVENYEKYSELLPNLIQARVFLASAYIKNRQFDKSEQVIDQLLRINPNQPFINQLKGVVRYEAKDFVEAKRYTEIAIQNGIDTVPNHVIAGLSAMQLKNSEQAFQHLDSVRDKLPPGHPVLRLLAMLELNLGHSLDAGETLSELEGLSQDDMILLSAASAQLMREGRTSQAQALLDKVNDLDISDPLRIAQKGMMRLSLNDLEGITDLEQALAMEPGQAFANNALAQAYVEQGMFDKALELAQTWIGQNPEAVNGYILAAVAFAGNGDSANEKEMYDKAIAIDSANPAGNIYYANKLVSQGQDEQALEYLNVIIAGHPKYVPALKKYFVLQQKLNRSADGLVPIEAAYKADTENMQYRMLYAQALFTDKQFAKTIALLEEVSVKESTPDQYWIVLGNAYVNSLQMDKASRLAQQWMSSEPNNRQAYLRAIATYELLKDSNAALDVAKSGLLKFVGDDQFAILVAYFSLVNGDNVLAERTYARLSDEVKNSVQGQGILGQILLAKGQAQQALPKLQALYQRSKSQINSTLVARALKELKQYSEAVKFLQAHQQAVGYSVASEVQIAEIYIVSGQMDMASKQYRSILQKEPDNSRVLNNLAYILIQQKNYADAVNFAKHAVEVEPSYIPFQDTYATALLNSGQTKAAAEIFETIYKANSADIGIGLRYAEALVLSNEPQRAEKVISSLENSRGLSAADKSLIEQLKTKI